MNTDYKQTISLLRQEKVSTPAQKIRVSLQDPKGEFTAAAKAVFDELGEQFVWLPEYDNIVAWLADNEGKGLLLYGAVGRGKSIVARYVLPMIFRAKFNRIMTVVSCANLPDDIQSRAKSNFIVLDDIGCESDSVDYGNRYNVVEKVVANIADRGGLLICTSNLDYESLRSRYGLRIVDRLRQLCCRVVFNGDSLRR